MTTKRTGSVLVVDDHENWRKLLATLLESDGHQIMTARNVQEAKVLLTENNFDVAILDMRLVDNVFDVQGMLLLREAKELCPSMKAVILTGFPDTEQRAKALDFYGANGYYEKAPDGKPFDIDQFSQLIFELLGKQE